MKISNGNAGQRVRAGIELEGPVLRYAEIEQVGSRFRLVRLGSCEFDFDITDVLLGDGSMIHFETIQDALHDVFLHSKSEVLNVAVHPVHGVAYVTTLPVGIRPAESERRIRDELELLAGDPDSLHIEAENTGRAPLYDGTEVDWIQVLAVPEQAGARFDNVVPALEQNSYRLSASTQAAVRIVHQMVEQGEMPATSKPVLTAGLYDGYIELALSQAGRVMGTHLARVRSGFDLAYFATAILSKYELRPTDTGAVCLYGSRYEYTDLKPLHDVFGPDTIRLNPVAVVSLDPASLTSSFDSEAYVPCIGIAL